MVTAPARKTFSAAAPFPVASTIVTAGPPTPRIVTDLPMPTETVSAYTPASTSIVVPFGTALIAA